MQTSSRPVSQPSSSGSEITRRVHNNIPAPVAKVESQNSEGTGVTLPSQPMKPSDVLKGLEKLGKNKGTGNVEDRFEYIWTGEYVTTEFKEKVVEISDRLDMNPDDLMGIMAFESYIDPTTVNSIGATGLIQFMPSTAKWLGTSTDDLAKMSAIEQLDYVEKYFKSFTGNLNDISDAYMTVLLPVAVGKDREFALGVKGSDEIFFGKITYGQFYKNNAGLDYNNDGKITKWEATKKVIERRDTYEKK